MLVCGKAFAGEVLKKRIEMQTKFQKDIIDAFFVLYKMTNPYN